MTTWHCWEVCSDHVYPRGVVECSTVDSGMATAKLRCECGGVPAITLGAEPPPLPQRSLADLPTLTKEQSRQLHNRAVGASIAERRMQQRRRDARLQPECIRRRPDAVPDCEIVHSTVGRHADLAWHDRHDGRAHG